MKFVKDSMEKSKRDKDTQEENPSDGGETAKNDKHVLTPYPFKRSNTVLYINLQPGLPPFCRAR